MIDFEDLCLSLLTPLEPSLFISHLQGHDMTVKAVNVLYPVCSVFWWQFWVQEQQKYALIIYVSDLYMNLIL